MTNKNFITQEQYDNYASLKEHTVHFSNDEIYIFKLGYPPAEKIEFFLNGTVKVEIERVIFVKEKAINMLAGLSSVFHIVNPENKALNVRFNKGHFYQIKKLSTQAANEAVDNGIRQYLQLIKEIGEGSTSKNKAKQSHVENLRFKYDELSNIKNNLLLFKDEANVFQSNFYRFITYDYVYIQNQNKDGKTVKSKSHLSKNKPNVIIINDNYKKTFFKRGSVLSDFSNRHFIAMDEISPFDIFADFGGKKD